MSEYSDVERPFLQQLEKLGWEVIDQGYGSIPTDPAASLRTSFRQVILPEVFREVVRSINLTGNGEPWLTGRQLDAPAPIRGKGDSRIRSSGCCPVSSHRSWHSDRRCQASEFGGTQEPVIYNAEVALYSGRKR